MKSLCELDLTLARVMNFNLDLRQAPTPSTRRLVFEAVERTKRVVVKLAPVVILLEHTGNCCKNPSPACLAVEVHACNVIERKPRRRAGLADRLDARIGQGVREEVMHFSNVAGVQRSEGDDPFSVLTLRQPIRRPHGNELCP